MLCFFAATALVPSAPAHAAYIATKADYPEAAMYIVKTKATGKRTGASTEDAIGIADVQSVISLATRPVRFHLLPGAYDFPQNLNLINTLAPLVIFEGIGPRTSVSGPAGAPLFAVNDRTKVVLRYFRIPAGSQLASLATSNISVISVEGSKAVKTPVETGLPVPATARTVFIAPDGTGKRLGTDAANALSLADFLRNELNPQVATRFHFLPGTYPLKSAIVFNKTGTQQIVMEGAGDTTLFTGVFAYPEKNATSAFLALNRSDIMVRKLAASNVGSLVKVATSARADKILIDDVTVTDSHQAISANRYGKFASVADWHINDLRIKGFYEAGMRLAGPTTKNIKVTKTTIDAKNSAGMNDCWVGGVQLLEYVSFVTLEDVKVSNTVGTCAAGTYVQGDGVEADGKQGLPHDLTFRKVTVENARDGSFDIKAENVLLEDIKVIQGPVSRFPLRLWTGKNYKCVRCDIPAGGNGHLNSLRSHVEFTDMVQDPATFKFECKVGTSKTATDEGFRILKDGKLVRTAYCKK